MQTTNFVVLAVLAVFAAAQTDANACYDGPQQMGGQNMSKDTVVAQMVGVFFAELGNAIAGDADFKSFMQSRGQCQIACAEKIVPVAFSTLYGKCGKDLASDACRDFGIESITGAFMACFPKAPRNMVHTTMSHILNKMGNAAPKENSELFKANPKCSNEASDFDMDKFFAKFDAAFGAVIASKPRVQQFFQEKALHCQNKCIVTTVAVTASTMFQTGMLHADHHHMPLDAATGAARACFPGVPREAMKDLMGAVIALTRSNEENEKLYNANVEVETMSSTSLPMIGGAAVVSLMIFAVVAVGRRALSRQQVRSTPISGDSELEEALEAVAEE